MQEAEMGVTALAENHGNRYNGDEQLLVKFYRHAAKDRKATLEAGRPIFRDMDYISIMQPGNKDSIVQRPASLKDKNRFAVHWQKYQARESQETISGTPLEEWGGLTEAQKNELKYMNVRSVEQLVNITDTNAQGMMGIHSLKERAKRFLEGNDADKLAAENKEKDDLIVSMKKRLDALEETAKKPPAKRKPAAKPAAKKEGDSSED